MTADSVRATIASVGIIPAVRVSSAEDARFAAETVCRAGIPIVEITMTVPGALDVIARLAAARPEIVIGAGTVMDAEGARQCLDAGAHFITSPGLDLGVVESSLKAGVFVLPGVMTPTDVTAAWRGGADTVKVFPCAPLGGPSYVKVLTAPFPHVRFVAAGGVNQQTAGEFILAGAVAVGVGTELIPRRAVQARDSRWITELAKRYLAIVQEARTRIREAGDGKNHA